tara:strand:- start:34 stop:426 length:393 start_codon:yes stop_codon:yes gene_type:complete
VIVLDAVFEATPGTLANVRFSRASISARTPVVPVDSLILFAKADNVPNGLEILRVVPLIDNEVLARFILSLPRVTFVAAEAVKPSECVLMFEFNHVTTASALNVTPAASVKAVKDFPLSLKASAAISVLV